MFKEKKILEAMESLRFPNGSFIASPTFDYSAMWIRDHLYCTLTYWYLQNYEKLKQGTWVIFDLLLKYKKKIESRVASPLGSSGEVLHIKYHPETLEEITTDDGWGHDQLDAIGLFLHIVADLDFKNIRIIRNEKDLEILQLLIYYLRSIEYWHHADFGMWEECKIRHSSSIGAVVGGLSYLRKQRLALVPDPLIKLGEDALNQTLPFESRDRCHKPHHNHDCDAAQLSLIWPYHVIVKPQQIDEIINRIIQRLLQTHGLNRFWGDDYYRSTKEEWRGISAEWPMFKFWLSIIYSQLHNQEKALQWFDEGCKEIQQDNKIPEAYCNGQPNNHSPLAWAHAIALIAYKKLSTATQKKVG